MSDRTVIDAVVLDLDGTLVDSVPVHVLAWQASFRDVGLVVPSHRIQRAIGMGGDRLVSHVCDQAVEDAVGDELRRRHPIHLDQLFWAISPTEGAVDLLEMLRKHDLEIVLTSSSDRRLTERLLGLVDRADELIGHAVTGSDSEHSKPHGEPVEAALKAVGAQHAVVIGDAVWDVQAAGEAGVPCIGLLTGGISEAELVDAGAASVFETPAALAGHLARTGSLLPMPVTAQ